MYALGEGLDVCSLDVAWDQEYYSKHFQEERLSAELHVLWLNWTRKPWQLSATSINRAILGIAGMSWQRQVVKSLMSPPISGEAHVPSRQHQPTPELRRIWISLPATFALPAPQACPPQPQHPVFSMAGSRGTVVSTVCLLHHWTVKHHWLKMNYYIILNTTKKREKWLDTLWNAGSY